MSAELVWGGLCPLQNALPFAFVEKKKKRRLKAKKRKKQNPKHTNPNKTKPHTQNVYFNYERNALIINTLISKSNAADKS